MTDTPTMVYLAEPIDQAPARAGHPAGLFTSLVSAGYNVYRPAAGWNAPSLDPRVDQINREALYRADCLVANLTAGIPTIGVPVEIEAATARGIPAVVLHDGNSQVLAANPLVTVIDVGYSAAECVAHAVRKHPRQVPGLRLVIRDHLPTPGRAYDDDAGVDLTTAIGVVIEPGDYADISTNVTATELPPGYWGLITGRSSTLRKLGLFVPNGVIDPGWRGPLFVGAWNLTRNPVTVKVGDRIGQLILIPNNPAPVAVVPEVSYHARGTNGFGSSGT